MPRVIIQAPPERLAYLRQLRAERKIREAEHRKSRMRHWTTPGELAAAIDPATVQTPALDLIDNALVWAYSTPGARLVISCPPQEGKSTRVTKVGSLWKLTRDPETRIGVVSYAQSLADGFGRDVRNMIVTFDGTEGTLDLGLRIASDYGSARRWQLAGHRGGVVCAGVGSGLTGRPLDAICVDDPFADAEQAGSAYYRERVWDWWRSVGAPRLAPGAPAIVVLTRWHEDDFAGRLAGAEDSHRWRVINIPALADHDPAKGQADPLGREPGEWLTSARGRTVAEWEQIRIQSGSRTFAALYQGRPSPDQGNVWLRQWWRRYREPLWSQHPDVPGAYLVHGCDEVMMSWDLAFKATSGSDYVVGQTWARRGADVFLLDQVHKRLSFTDTLVAFQAMVARWPQASRKLVEEAANGAAVLDSLRSKIPGIVPVKPHESKYARASAVAPFVEAGNVFLPTSEIALFDPEPLIDEAAGFPNAAHDDQVDATSQALAELLLDGNGAAAWIAWAKRKAEQAAAAAAGDGPSGAGPSRPATTAVLTEPPPAGPYQKCRKPDCMRRISLGAPAGYCCTPCADATDGQYEIHAHSPGCDERAGERGPATATEVADADPAAARKRARDQMFQEQRHTW
jgi:predicted phage terminase large subunit-like protein